MGILQGTLVPQSNSALLALYQSEAPCVREAASGKMRRALPIDRGLQSAALRVVEGFVQEEDVGHLKAQVAQLTP
jgi:hypothetical protein